MDDFEIFENMSISELIEYLKSNINQLSPEEKVILEILVFKKRVYLREDSNGKDN